jgi:hypothetical protein
LAAAPVGAAGPGGPRVARNILGDAADWVANEASAAVDAARSIA